MILSPGASASLLPLAVTSAVALLAYLLAALNRTSGWLGAALAIGWVAHALAIIVHGIGIGEPTPGARFGFAPALSVTAWLVLTVYAVESRLFPQLQARWALAGLLFSEQLYGAGKPWRWDHKAVFSVLSWLAFAVLLVGRARFGWRGRTAVRVLYAGSLLLLLAYAGSRFVLEVVLGRAA